jgi:riboflavin synthase
LHALKAGQPINIEADVMIKFMEQRSSQKQEGAEFDLSVEYLIANGY